jgi:hypothetical protein
MTNYQLRILNEARIMFDALLCEPCDEPTRQYVVDARYALDQAMAAHWLSLPEMAGSGGASAPEFADIADAWRHAVTLQLAHGQKYIVESINGGWRAIREES